MAWSLISFSTNIPLPGRNQFIYPFTHWRTFWLLPSLAIMNEATINILMQGLCRHSIWIFICISSSVIKMKQFTLCVFTKVVCFCANLFFPFSVFFVDIFHVLYFDQFYFRFKANIPEKLLKTFSSICGLLFNLFVKMMILMFIWLNLSFLFVLSPNALKFLAISPPDT